RHSGWDLERRGDLFSVGVQADRDDRARAKNCQRVARTEQARRARSAWSVRLTAGGADGRGDGRARVVRSRVAAAGNQCFERMNSQLQAAAGSPLWQLVFVSFAFLLILFEVLRGWRRGLPRQVARLAALIAAYFAAYFGGKFLAPLL